jgi:hypothetical protein
MRKTFSTQALGLALLAILHGFSLAQSDSAPAEANSPAPAAPTTAPGTQPATRFGLVTTGPFVVTVGRHDEDPPAPWLSGVNHELLWLAGIIAVAYITIRILTSRAARRRRRERDRL